MNDMNMNAAGMSEGLYVTLCHILGFPTQVAIRRDITDLEERIYTLRAMKIKVMQLRSGSNREGFRLHGSDVDWMYWPTDHKVIWDYNQSDFYRSSKTAFIMMECCDTRPGFALLQLLTSPTIMVIRSTCISNNDGIYISSSLYREKALTFGGIKNTVHGPCATICIRGLEFDQAHCFSCDFWPPLASSFIERSHIKGWPPSRVLQDIVNNGCHVVPIGRRNSPQEQNEWRISFSVAEQKLVYAMNHCQFLCYGILKLFLKEVINSTWKEPLLCSYFLKTILFWEIQGKEINTWTPQNILPCIWQCFKHLIKLVEREECPNFFIPTNNMFYGKVVGAPRSRLLSQLYGLYSVGMSCLIRFPSVWSVMETLGGLNSTQRININENIWLPTAGFDNELFNEINTNCDYMTNLLVCYNTLPIFETIQQTPLSEYQSLGLQVFKSIALVSTGFHLHGLYNRAHQANRVKYYIDQKVCHMLRKTAKYGNVTNYLYIAMYYYMTCRCKEALYYVEIAKVKLSRPYLMYGRRVNEIRYNEAVEGMSPSSRMREAYASDVTLFLNCFIHEMKLEIKANERKMGFGIIHIPPHVMVSLMSVLCHRGNSRKQEGAIYDLQTLLTNGDGTHIHYEWRSIAWQILGLCQQIYGDLHAALISYQEALKYTDRQINEIEEASKARIQHVQCALQNYYYHHY